MGYFENRHNLCINIPVLPAMLRSVGIENYYSYIIPSLFGSPYKEGFLTGTSQINLIFLIHSSNSVPFNKNKQINHIGLGILTC